MTCLDKKRVRFVATQVLKIPPGNPDPGRRIESVGTQIVDGPLVAELLNRIGKQPVFLDELLKIALELAADAIYQGLTQQTLSGEDPPISLDYRVC